MSGVGAMTQVMPQVGNQDSMSQERVRNVRIAMSKGYRFIELMHNKPGSIPERIYPVDGIMVTVRHNSLTKTNESVVTKKEGREILFVPDPDTGVRSAFLLDTEHNRRLLATHLLEKRWTILDNNILGQIEELASSIPMEIDTSKMHERASSQPTVTKEDVVRGMNEQQLNDSIAQKRKELELLEKEKDTKESKAPEATGEEEKAAPNQIVSNKLKKQIPPDILERATSVVYQRNATTIAGMKAKHGSEDFIKSEEFLKKIQPQVDAELMKAMNESQGVEEQTGDTDASDKGAAARASV